MTAKPRFKVFLFEDMQDDEQLALRALRSSGIAVDIEVARDGEQALAILGIWEDRDDGELVVPDLVISDLKMPKMGGDQVLARVRACRSLREVPYVLFSSSDERSDIERCMSLGATDYCVKPVDYHQFIECIRGIAQRWLSERESEEPDCLLQSSVGS